MASPPVAPDEPLVPHSHLGAHKVLVIDDDPANRLLLSDLLVAHHHQVACAETGRQALVLASKQQPDLVLLDRRLPDIDGYLLCAQLRALLPSPATRILIMSGDDQSEAHSRSLQAGADDFLAKPLGLAELLARL